jgi:hypothetical protein
MPVRLNRKVGPPIQGRACFSLIHCEVKHKKILRLSFGKNGKRRWWSNFLVCSKSSRRNIEKGFEWRRYHGYNFFFNDDHRWAKGKQNVWTKWYDVCLFFLLRVTCHPSCTRWSWSWSIYHTLVGRGPFNDVRGLGLRWFRWVWKIFSAMKTFSSAIPFSDRFPWGECFSRFQTKRKIWTTLSIQRQGCLCQSMRRTCSPFFTANFCFLEKKRHLKTRTSHESGI